MMVGRLLSFQRPIFRGYVGFKEGIRVYNPNRWVTLETRRLSNCFSPRPRHRLLHIPGLVFTLGVFLLVGTWDIREGQWLGSTSEMTKLCFCFLFFFIFFRSKGESLYKIYIHLFVCLQDAFNDERHVWCVCVCVLNNICCLSSLTLTFRFLVMAGILWLTICGASHVLLFWVRIQFTVWCMHVRRWCRFIDVTIVRIFLHGLFKKTWGLEQGFSSHRYYIYS